MRRTFLMLVSGLFLLSAAQCDAQIFHKKKRVNKSTSAENTAEPDKILYDKAMNDIKRGRHEVGRLNLQTLINTYPDSEYLAKAKLAIADSFYKEGGTANMTQAIQAYKDFDVFFPMLPEAAYAQLQVALAHYRQMEKPDRDRTQAREAEDEFQTFLTKYPNDPLAPKAEQYLREVQEVLAEGDFRIGYFYYVKGDKKAAESRLKGVAVRYPLYSKADRALWMLGNIWESTEKKELAAPFYAQIVRNYPLSPLVPNAKGKLKGLGAPIPQPDPKAVAWMTAERNAPRPHESFVKKPLSLVHSGPGEELRVAARVGKPPLTPESENEAGTEILTGGKASRTGATGTGIVATITPGTGGGTTGSAESVPPTSDETAAAPAAQPDGNAAGTTSDPPNGATPTGTTDAGTKTDATAPDAKTIGDGQATDGATSSASTDAAGAAAGAAKTQAAAGPDGTQNQANGDKKKESSSKKKKGLRKIVPW